MNEQSVPNTVFIFALRYTYKLGHKLVNGTYVWSKSYSFKSSPYPGQDSLQRVVIFGDMGKVINLACLLVSRKTKNNQFTFSHPNLGFLQSFFLKYHVDTCIQHIFSHG